jgi:hypothetical protein
MRPAGKVGAMTTYTIVATVDTELSEDEIRFRIDAALDGCELIPCNWAPDPDTISDATDFRDIHVVDMN